MFVRRIILFLAFAGLCVTQPGYAQDQTSSDDMPIPFVFAPDHCEFTATFPEEPLKARKCDGDDPDRCYDQISFTHVYDMSSTVSVRVLCNAVGPEVRDGYGGEIMKATLKAMTDDAVVQTYDTSFRETSLYKQAGLVGEGQMGKFSTIYIAQLWIGERSAFSLEAELVGPQNDNAERTFSDFLRTVGHKDEIGSKTKVTTAEE